MDQAEVLAAAQLLELLIPAAEQLFSHLHKSLPAGSVPTLAQLRATADSNFQSVIDAAKQ